MDIYIVQLVYLNDGHEDVFDEFEKLVIPLLQKYSGKMMLRMRPTGYEIIERSIPSPYEIHLLSFRSNEDFERFLQDEERKRFLHLKERAIASTFTIKGFAM